MIVPKLRFSEFKGKWFKKKIGDFIVNHVGGASFTPNDFVKESNFEVIPKKAIMSGGKLILDKENPTFSSEVFYQNNLKNTIDKSYLVTTLRDLVPSGPSIGYIVSFDDDKKYILAQGVYGFRIKDDLNRNFLIQFSNTSKFRTIMQSKMVGSTQVHIRNQDYFDTEIYKPCLEEQTKIAEFLSVVDDKISQLSRQLELLNQYKKGVMQKIFSQEIRFKNDNGEDFGEWEEVPLNQIASKVTVKNRGNKVTEVLTNSATQGIIKQSDFFDREIVSESNINGYYVVEVDDFVYNPRISVHAPVGPIKRNKITQGIMSPLYTVFRFKEGNLDFLSYFFGTNFWHDYVKSVANSGARHDRMNITNSDFLEMPILLPSIQEQEKIAEFLTAIDKRIDHTTAQLTHTKQWKKGLLQQMFV